MSGSFRLDWEAGITEYVAPWHPVLYLPVGHEFPPLTYFRHSPQPLQEV